MIASLYSFFAKCALPASKYFRFAASVEPHAPTTAARSEPPTTTERRRMFIRRSGSGWEVSAEQRRDRAGEVESGVGGRGFRRRAIVVHGHDDAHERGVRPVQPDRIEHEIDLAPVLARDDAAVALVPVHDDARVQALLNEIPVDDGPLAGRADRQ